MAKRVTTDGNLPCCCRGFNSAGSFLVKKAPGCNPVPLPDSGELMRTTILFGGLNRERLVAVASTQAISAALPDADLWFWDVGDTVHETRPDLLQKHERPFEIPFKPGSPSF